MKTRTRILLAGLAGVLAACGTLVGPTELVHAKPASEFPTCFGAKVSHSQMRVWINPGDLYDPNTLKVGTVHLDRRRDGIWTGIVVSNTDGTMQRWILAEIDGGENGFWVKCKKVKP